ncbi:hypothetical protein HYC85_028747 [Camellia sinensis]|uniref:Uncharacterized protein n=1 Tax=Camellia sinensis TaxID=4442 RepID=A0A7J7G005_CAMSI|nr:hypothetical protein HYC85_028747 [Camellia sinensis]
MAKSHKAHRKAPPPKKPNKTNEKVMWVCNTCQLQFEDANRDHNCGYLGKPIKGVEPKKKDVLLDPKYLQEVLDMLLRVPMKSRGVANSIGLPIEHDCGQVNELEARVNGFIPGKKLPTEAQPVIPAASESMTNGHAYTTPTMDLNPPPRTNTSTPDTVAPGGVGIPVPVVQTITPLSLSKSLLGQMDTTSVWVGKHDKLMLIRPDLGLDLPPTYHPETLTNPSPEPTQPPSPPPQPKS